MMKIISGKVFLCLCALLFVQTELFSQYSDGPIELRVRVREIHVGHSGTDFSLGFSPDDFTFKVWARDDMGSGWQGGQCLTSDFDPPATSADLNTEIFARTYPTATVPQVFDIRLEAWEDDLDADPLSGACGGSRCTFTANACCVSNPFGGCIFSEGDDNYCNSNPFRTGIDYRLGNPCRWFSHGMLTGGCNNNYLPRIESYWRYLNGDNCSSPIDVGTLNPGGMLSHVNSTECYNNDFGDPGNDVFLRFTIAQAMGVRINLCNGATFNTTLYLLDGNCNQLYINRDEPSCSPQSMIAENLCTPGNYYIVIDGSTAAEMGLFNITIGEDPSLAIRTNIIRADVSCNGLSDGSATINVTGGTPSYQYLWAPGGSTSNSISGLVTGQYIARVTDARNCTVFDTVVINQPQPIAFTTQGYDPVCNGEATGEISVPSVTGGTTPYEYAIPGLRPYQPTSAFTGLPAGTHNVVVRDAHTCEESTDVTLTDPPRIQGNLASTPETCAGFSDGTITPNPSMGAAPYLCAINFPQVFNTCTGVYDNLPRGTYYITIRDANNCEIIEAIDVDLVPSLTLTLFSKKDVDCYGGNDGEIRVSSTNGVLPKRFSIDGGTTFQNDSVFAGLTAALYTVLVQDGNGCEVTLNVQVDEPSELIGSELFQISVTCNGEGDGLMVITASGGTGPYRYSMDSVNFYQSGAFNYLSGGTYHFIVVDNHSCVDTFSASMFEPDVLAVNAASSANASCGGINDATLTLGATGGTAPFKFSINNGPLQTSPTFTGLTAGTYLIGVEDRNDCVAFDSATIGANISLTATVIKTDVLCHGESTGVITVSTVTGGTPAYEYSINNIIFQPAGTFTGLAAGNYTLIVRDVNQCTYVEAVDILEPPVLSAVVDSTTDAACPGIADGAVYITPSGGVPNYSFSWSNSLQTEDIVNVEGGNYSVVISDLNNCEFTLSATVDAPAAAYTEITVDDVTCSGETDGRVDLDVVGGVPPFAYAWSNNAQTQDLTRVAGGIYHVTITDDEGCEVYAMAEVIEPAAITSTITATGVSCATSAEADIELTPSGGTPPYDFLWSNFVFTEDQTDVPAGTYTVIITDVNDCEATNSITIASAPGLTATFNVTGISCFGLNDGQAEINVSGGTSPYSYSWSNSQNTSLISGLAPGIYDVTVTDSVACAGEFSAFVEDPDELKVDAFATDVLCYEDNSGIAVPYVTGGTGANTFSWNTSPPSDNPVQTTLSAGAYILEVWDENGCSAKDTVIVSSPDDLTVSIAGTDNIICLSGTDGEITVLAEGGVRPYQYSVKANLFQSDSLFTGLEAGEYGVMVIDNNGCFATNSFTLTESAGFTVDLDPYLFIALGASDTIKSKVILTDSIASIEWTPSDNLSCTDCPNPVVTPVEDKTYTVVVTDINGCVSKDEITVVVETEYEVHMPNIFSPNGDGFNDVYYPIDLGAVRTATLQIFNRWGAVIFETRNINEGWDGTFKGSEVNPGVFVYHITGDFLDGNTFDKIGSVTLVR